MGGRGSSSGFSFTSPLRASDASDLDALATYMSDKYAMRLNVSALSKCDFESVRTAASGIEDIIVDFPGAALNFHELTSGNTGSAQATASYNGVITLAQHAFDSTKKYKRSYDYSVRAKWHPEGTDGDHIAVHEAGHILERALIDKYVLSKGNSFLVTAEARNAWQKCTYASKVISEASKIVKKLPSEKGKGIKTLITDVSGYAAKNRSEALAECVADYKANGRAAKPLSVAVWDILKRELG